MDITVDGRTTLALGDSTPALSAVLRDFPDLESAWRSRDALAAAVTADPQKQRAVVDFLRGEMVRAGLPVSEESHALLEADARRDELNAETGAETNRLVLEREYQAHLGQRDFPRTGEEQNEYDRNDARLRRELRALLGPDGLLELQKRLGA